jgi:hypothetical protein
MLDFIKRLRKSQDAALAAVKELAGVDVELKAQHAANVKEREQILTLPPPVDEIVRNLERAIDEGGAHKAGQLHWTLVNVFGGSCETQADGSVLLTKPGMLRLQDLDRVTFADLCALAPAVVKENLAAIVRSKPYDAGLPMAERLAALAKVDAEIARIEQAHTDFVAEAASMPSPIVFELLPAVRDRRAKEKRNAELKAENEAWNQRQAALNPPSSAPRPRVGESQYLKQGRIQ